MADGAGQPAFADARRPDNRAVLVVADPVALEQRLEQAAIEPARSAVIDVFGRGMVPQLCVTQAQCKAPVIAPGCFVIQQQSQPFGVAQAGGIAIVVEFGERMGHAGQAELVQLIKGWVFEHRRSFQW